MFTFMGRNNAGDLVECGGCGSCESCEAEAEFEAEQPTKVERTLTDAELLELAEVRQ